MKKYICLLIYSTIALCAFSQVVKEVNARLFSIVSEKGDTIHFLKTDTSLISKKATIIFCQGSLPIPLIIIDKDITFIPCLNNFNYRGLSEKYNIIVISMPHTPPVATKEQLNNQYQYVPNVEQGAKFDSIYLRDNYKENYVARANCVIGFLKKQKCVDKNRIAIFGHSQGSYIAVELAKQNPFVRGVGYSGGTPAGRFSLFIRQQRRSVISKIITAEQGQKNIEEYYRTWKSYCKGVDPKGDSADKAKTWTSFTLPLWDDLIRLKTPIFIPYGTEDLESSEGCELLPLYFETAGKTNYLMKPYVGCGHNFEEISAEGISNFDKMHWDDVMNSFTKWLEGL